MTATTAAPADTLWEKARAAQRRFLDHTPACYTCPQPGYACPTRQALWRAYETARDKAAAATTPVLSSDGG